MKKMLVSSPFINGYDTCLNKLKYLISYIDIYFVGGEKMRNTMLAIFLVAILLVMPFAAALAVTEEDNLVLENDFTEALVDDTNLDTLVATATGEEVEETTEETNYTNINIEDKPTGIGMALLRIRYALSMNAERKSELGLRIAEARLMEAKERLEERNIERSTRSLEQYQQSMERVREQLAKVSAEKTTNAKIVELQKRIDLHRAIVQKMQNESLVNDELNSQEKEQIENRIREVSIETERTKAVATERRNQIRERSESTEDDETDTEAEEQLLDKVLGEKRAAEVMIRSASYAHERVRLTYERLQNSSTNEELMLQVKAQYEESKALLLQSKEQYDSGNYGEAKRLAIESRFKSSRMHSFIMSNAAEIGSQAREAVRNAIQEQLENKREGMSLRFVQDNQNSNIILVFNDGAIRQRLMINVDEPIAEQIAAQLNMTVEQVRMRLQLNERTADIVAPRIEERINQTAERLRPVEQRPVVEDIESIEETDLEMDELEIE
jgi:hypothetical protein